MVYFDYGQNRYVCSTPTVIPDIRAHLANWRQFRKATGSWPLLSITTFLARFLIMIVGITAVLWCGAARHDWTKGQFFLVTFVVLVPVLIVWFLIERTAWNRDLRRKGIARDSDVWGIEQFPQR